MKWLHKAMISLDEFDRVQELLWKKGNPRAKTHSFPFTWMIKCWECWCSITAEHKRKYIASTWKTHKYIYYHCTKKRKALKCSQKTIRDNELEKQVLEILNAIEIIPDFRTWAISTIKEEFDNDIDLKIKQSESINKSILSEENKLKKLTDILINELIWDDEYKIKKKGIEEIIIRLKEERENIDLKWKQIYDSTIDTFNFVSSAVESFKNWDLEAKKEILSALGKNFILRDWKVLIELNPWFKVIYDRSDEIRWWLKRFETQKNSTSKVNTNAINNNNPKWFRI